MLPDICVPHFNERKHLDKLANFFANKIFNFLKDPEVNRSYSRKALNDKKNINHAIAKEDVFFYIKNCEYVLKINLLVNYAYTDNVTIVGEVLFCRPDVIDISCDLPAKFLYGDSTNVFGYYKEKLQSLYLNLVSTIRHELQHVIQMFYITDKDIEKMVSATNFYKINIKNILQKDEKYFTYPAEIEAFVKAWKLLAKKQKMSWKDYMKAYITYRCEYMSKLHPDKDNKQIQFVYEKIVNKILDFESNRGNELTYLRENFENKIAPHIY